MSAFQTRLVQAEHLSVSGEDDEKWEQAQAKLFKYAPPVSTCVCITCQLRLPTRSVPSTSAPSTVSAQSGPTTSPSATTPPPPPSGCDGPAYAGRHLLTAADWDAGTALLHACALGHETVAAMIVAPTNALDAVGCDGFSALLWAEERRLDGVARSLRESGATAVRRPALALFRGEAGAVQVDVNERTVAFTGSFATVRSALQCPLGPKKYYEMEILAIEQNSRHRYGFATASLACACCLRQGPGR